MSILIFNNGVLEQNANKQKHLYINDHPSSEPSNTQTTASMKTNKTLSYINTDKDSLDNRRRLLASHVMSSPVVTAMPHDLVSHAVQLMNAHEISHIVIVNELSNPLGTLYVNDIVKVDSPATSFIQNILNTTAIAVSETTLVRDIAATFMKYKSTAISVVDNNHQLVGIISRNDLMGLLISSPNQKIKA